jgi:hypothetical protein
MRRARPEELNEDARPIALLRLSKDRFEELFPVEMSDSDPLSAAEPSIGGLVQLDSGPYAVVVYGKTSGEAEVSLPVSAPMPRQWKAFLSEVPLATREIVWTSDKVAPPAISRPSPRKPEKSFKAAVTKRSKTSSH